MAQAFHDGDAHPVPLMIGSNADEGTALYWGSPSVAVPPPVDTVAAYTSAVTAVFGNVAGSIGLYSWPGARGLPTRVLCGRIGGVLRGTSGIGLRQEICGSR